MSHLSRFVTVWSMLQARVRDGRLPGFAAVRALDMPDPKQDDNGGVMIEAMPGGDAGSIDEDKMKSAHEACKQHLPNGGEKKARTD